MENKSIGEAPQMYSRRDFLKAGGIVIGAVAIKKALDKLDLNGRGSTEEERSPSGYFFENIESFDNSKFEEVRSGLLKFGDRYGSLLKSKEPTNGFDEEKWKNEVVRSTSVLRRISTVYKDLEQEGELGELEESFLKRDFYDVGSTLWAIVRVGEKFENDQLGLEGAIDNSHIKKENGYEDPFLGTEIFAVDSDWADTFSNGKSKIVEILDHNDLSCGSVDPWWRKLKGEENLFGYKEDPELPGRPIPFNIELSDTPEFKKQVEDILQKSRLYRVGINFDVVATEGEKWDGYYRTIDEGGRDVTFRVGGGLTENNIKELQYLFNGTIIHESAHALWELVPFIENDTEVFKQRMNIEKMLALFRPYSSLERYFQPQGKIPEPIDPKINTPNITDWNQRYRHINMATTTSYASQIYSSVDLMSFRNFMEQMTDKGGTMYVYELIDKIVDRSNQANNLDSVGTFTEFWQKAVHEINEDPDSRKPNEFEKMILDAITNNIKTFEAFQIPDYMYRWKWSQYLEYTVIPVVAVQLYNKDPGKFVKTCLDTVNNPNAEIAFEKHIKNVFSKLNGKRPIDDSDYKRGYLKTDAELFAEIVAFNHVRKMKGVKNEINGKIWKQVDNTINGLIDNLIKDHLAMNSSTSNVAV